MRVVLLCGAFRPSRDGVAHYVARLGGALRAAGVDVVVAGGAGGEGAAVTVTGSWHAAGAATAGAALRTIGADLVHVQWAPTAYGPDRDLAALVPALGDLPLVTTLHEYDGPDDRDAAALAAGSAAVLVTNPVHGDRLAARLPGVAVTHVPIGANLAPATATGAAGAGTARRARAALRRSLRAPPDAPVVVFFGFVHPVKGIRYLIPAAARLRARRPALRLVLAGGFESLALPADEAAAWRAEVEAQVRDEGLDGVAQVTGFLPEQDLGTVLAGADVGVLPFTTGTTTKSGSLLALAAHGVPVVATAAAPPDPALRDGEGAVLVPTRSVAGLVEGLARVLDDPALAARLRAGGARLLAGRSWEAIAAAHLDRYREVLG